MTSSSGRSKGTFLTNDLFDKVVYLSAKTMIIYSVGNLTTNVKNIYI